MATSTWEGLEDEQRHHWTLQLLRRGAGLALIALALWVALALLSFDRADPSINHAVAGVVRNPAGRMGSTVADLLLQTLGRAAWLLPLIGLARGIRTVSGRPLDLPWLPLVALPLALMAASAFLATMSPPSRPDWPFRVGLGGFVGDFLLNRLLPFTSLTSFVWVSGIVAALLGVTAMGLRWGESRWFLTHAAKLLAWTGRHSARAATLIAKRAKTILGRGETDEPAAPAERAPLVGRQGWLAIRLAQLQTGLWRLWSREGTSAARGHDQFRRSALSDREGTEAATRQDREAAAATTKSARPRRRLDPEAEPPPPELELTEAVPVDPVGDAFQLPAPALLDQPKRQPDLGLSKSVLTEISRRLEAVLDDFGVRGQILDAKPGPVVTLFELEPAPGTRSQRVISLADDIARSLSVISVRVATVPGRNVIGIELPNDRREIVFLRELVESETYRRSEARLPIALGKDISGNTIIVDLARMPHLLIAGTTGSGKSVAINAMILSLVFKLTPAECRIIMIDPKVIELSVYEDIPHLLAPVVTEPHKAVVALKWVVRQMDERYRLMSHLGVRDIFAFNRRIMQAKARGEQLKRRVRTGFEPGTGMPIMEDQPIDMTPLPLIVVIVDEVADLMLTAGKEIEHCIQRLSQKARAAGVHLVVATQRPSVDVLTGVIKANLPSRISFRVSSKIDSRTILGDMGAEQLLGQGDMLYLMPGDRISRIHGALVTDHEVEAVVRHLKSQGYPDYDDGITTDGESDTLTEPGNGGAAGTLAGNGGSEDAVYRQAIDVVARDGKASTSYLQRKLGIGYNSAAKLIERMESDGLITQADHVGRRQVLMGRGGLDGNEPTHLD